MIPLNAKIKFSERYRSKGIDSAEAVYHKYGKDYPVKDYIQEYREGTNAKKIIEKAGGLKNLPGAQQKLKDAELTVDMNEDIYTINRKLKLGNIAQRKLEAIKLEKQKLEEAAKKAEPVKEGE